MAYGQKGDGFTSLGLAVGALVGPTLEAMVCQALEAVPQKRADNIVRRVIGTTLANDPTTLRPQRKCETNPG